MTKLKDSAIINYIQGGDLQLRDQAFTAIYSRCYKTVQKMIVQNKGTDEDAKDIFQESIIIFYQKVITNSISYPQYKASSFKVVPK